MGTAHDPVGCTVEPCQWCADYFYGYAVGKANARVELQEGGDSHGLDVRLQAVQDGMGDRPSWRRDAGQIVSRGPPMR